jgi:hypothetical protein
MPTTPTDEQLITAKAVKDYVAANFLPLAGGTLSTPGSLGVSAFTIGATPTATSILTEMPANPDDTQLLTAKAIKTAISGGSGGYLPLTGGTITGSLSINTDLTFLTGNSTIHMNTGYIENTDRVRFSNQNMIVSTSDSTKPCSFISAVSPFQFKASTNGTMYNNGTAQVLFAKENPNIYNEIKMEALSATRTCLQIGIEGNGDGGRGYMKLDKIELIGSPYVMTTVDTNNSSNSFASTKYVADTIKFGRNNIFVRLLVGTNLQDEFKFVNIRTNKLYKTAYSEFAAWNNPNGNIGSLRLCYQKDFFGADENMSLGNWPANIIFGGNNTACFLKYSYADQFHVVFDVCDASGTILTMDTARSFKFILPVITIPNT